MEKFQTPRAKAQLAASLWDINIGNRAVSIGKTKAVWARLCTLAKKQRWIPAYNCGDNQKMGFLEGEPMAFLLSSLGQCLKE